MLHFTTFGKDFLNIMIRTILSVLWAVFFLIVWIPVLGIEWLIGKKNKELMDHSSLHIVQWALNRINIICGIKLTVLGKENLPTDQAVLYVGNHRSYFDIILSYTLMPNLTGFISKDNLEKVPLLSTWMKRLYCLFLDRDDMKKSLKTIQKAGEQIKNGISMVIFPEGTRNKGEEGSLLPFKEGSLRMADKTGCPIIPMAISNTGAIVKKGKARPTHVVIEFGKPIYPKELEKEQRKALGAMTQNIIGEMLKEHQATYYKK